MKTALLFFVFLPVVAFSQEFTFQLVIEDAIGNKDSIVLGYDEDATEGIDPAFGEVDIAATPWDTALEVRAVSLYDFEELKYSITKNVLNGLSCYYSTNQFAVLTKHWPLKITWDSTLFFNVCYPLVEMANTDMFLNADVACWDGDMQYDNLKNSSSATYADAIPGSELCWYDYHGTLDSAKFFFVFFNNGVGMPEMDAMEFNIYPNPTLNNLKITSQTAITAYSISDISGRRFYSSTLNHAKAADINISSLSSGIYYIRLETENGVGVKKFVTE